MIKIQMTTNDFSEIIEENHGNVIKTIEGSPEYSGLIMGGNLIPIEGEDGYIMDIRAIIMLVCYFEDNKTAFLRWNIVESHNMVESALSSHSSRLLSDEDLGIVFEEVQKKITQRKGGRKCIIYR